MTTNGHRPRLSVLLASPRGFCAGVSRAIEIVENALSTYGAPVYVRHEIVHNAHVVNRLRAMGAIFVDEIDEAPNDRPIVFSAHGSPAAAHLDARKRGMIMLDAACPLVLKVHAQVRRFIEDGRHVFVVGHENHPEIAGVVGQASRKHFTIIETLDDALSAIAPTKPAAYVTQTTLSVDDTRAIIDALKSRIPGIVGPRKDDICYATSNRQDAVKAIAARAASVFVVGSATSSNSQRLVEVARNAGATNVSLVEDPAATDFSSLSADDVIGVTAGASAPEDLVEDLLAALAERFSLTIETVQTAIEDIVFKAPPLMNAS